VSSCIGPFLSFIPYFLLYIPHSLLLFPAFSLGQSLRRVFGESFQCTMLKQRAEGRICLYQPLEIRHSPSMGRRGAGWVQSWVRPHPDPAPPASSACFLIWKTDQSHSIPEGYCQHEWHWVANPRWWLPLLLWVKIFCPSHLLSSTKSATATLATKCT
jgi:hypothetical protein